MNESELLRGVIDLAHILGWRVAHFRPAKTAHGWRTPVQGDGVGWPDLVLLRRHRLVVAELKAANGKLTDDQALWLDGLGAAGIETFVWRPEHYPEKIMEALR